MQHSLVMYILCRETILRTETTTEERSVGTGSVSAGNVSTGSGTGSISTGNVSTTTEERRSTNEQ